MVTFNVAREALIAFRYFEPSLPSVDLATKLRSMTGPAFEEYVADISRNMGYVVATTQSSGDHGIDLFARKGDQLAIVQCKRWAAPVGEPVVRDFFGSLMDAGAQLGYVVAKSHFTAQARAFAQNKPIQLIDLDALLDLSTH
jgi:restriction system protein